MPVPDADTIYNVCAEATQLIVELGLHPYTFYQRILRDLSATYWQYCLSVQTINAYISGQVS
jgi:hypothetical protein